MGVSLGMTLVSVTRLLFDGGPCPALSETTEGLVDCGSMRCCLVVDRAADLDASKFE